MFNNFGTIRTRPSSAHLFEDSSDSEDCELRTKKEQESKESLLYQTTEELASLNLSAVFGASTLFENTIRPFPQAMSLKPKVRVPKLTLPYFDGESQNADRWMAALKQDFGAQDMDREDYPSLWLEAIYSRVSGKAEVWMDQTLLARNIMQNRDNATMIEVERFETEFRSRFPGSLTADPVIIMS